MVDDDELDRAVDDLLREIANARRDTESPRRSHFRTTPARMCYVHLGRPSAHEFAEFLREYRPSGDERGAT